MAWWSSEPVRMRGEALAAARRQRGWSLEDLADVTRIPIEHLHALEAERLEGLPEGPYLEAYETLLSQTLDAPVARSSRTELTVVRWLGLASLLLWFGMVAAAFTTGSFSTEVVVPAEGSSLPEFTLQLTVLREGNWQVQVDGSAVVDRRVESGERLQFAAEREFTLEGAAPEDVRIVWNGRRITPLGRQDQPRRFVFIDDARDR